MGEQLALCGLLEGADEGPRAANNNDSTDPKRRRPPGVSKGDMGAAARQIISGRMMLAGIDVFFPTTEDTPIDMLAMTSDGRFLKCQCKTIYYTKKTDRFTMPLCTVRKNGPGSKAIKHTYTEDEVDVFIGYSHYNDTVYVIPFKDAGGRSYLYMDLERGKPYQGRLDHRPYANNFEIFKTTSHTS